MENTNFISEIYAQIRKANDLFDPYFDKVGFHATIKCDGILDIYVNDRTASSFRVLIERDTDIDKEPMEALLSIKEVCGFVLGYLAAKKEQEGAKPEIEFCSVEENESKGWEQ